MAPATRQRLDLRFFVRGTDPDGKPLKIADNCNVFLDEWLRDTGCEVGFVAFDTFNLDESREPPQLGSIGDLTVVSFKDVL